MIKLDYKVFPSEEKTIEAYSDITPEGYEEDGAHWYKIKNCRGFVNGNTVYSEADGNQKIQFVQKYEDGTIVPGLQSEQLAYILLDRCVKLNKRFPSDHNAKMIAGLDIFLDACRERVEERIERGVMGELKK